MSKQPRQVVRLLFYESVLHHRPFYVLKQQVASIFILSVQYQYIIGWPLLTRRNCLNKTNLSPRLDFVKRFRAVHAYFVIVLNVLSLVHGDAKHQRPRRVQGYQLTVMVSKESARFARACVISPWNKTNTGNNGGKRKLLSLLLSRHERRRKKRNIYPTQLKDTWLMYTSILYPGIIAWEMKRQI